MSIRFSITCFFCAEKSRILRKMSVFLWSIRCDFPLRKTIFAGRIRIPKCESITVLLEPERRHLFNKVPLKDGYTFAFWNSYLAGEDRFSKGEIASNRPQKNRHFSENSALFAAKKSTSCRIVYSWGKSLFRCRFFRRKGSEKFKLSVSEIQIEFPRSKISFPMSIRGQPKCFSFGKKCRILRKNSGLSEPT